MLVAVRVAVVVKVEVSAGVPVKVLVDDTAGTAVKVFVGGNVGLATWREQPPKKSPEKTGSKQRTQRDLDRINFLL